MRNRIARGSLRKLWEGTIVRATIALACTIVAAQLLSATEPAQAQQEPWCLRTDTGGSDCGYSSRAQCMAGSASQNPICWQSRREHKGTPGAQASSKKQKKAVQ